MKDSFTDRAAACLGRRHRRRRWKQIVSILAAIVVFVTTYALILPAITLESNTNSFQSEDASPLPEEQSQEDEALDSESSGQPDGNPSDDLQKPDGTGKAEEAQETEATRETEEIQEPVTIENLQETAGDITYTPVVSMGLTMYRCVYYKELPASAPNGSLNNYVAQQISPGEKEMASYPNKAMRFLIQGAWQDDTFCLIPVHYFESVFQASGYTFSERDAQKGICPFYYSKSFTFSRSSSPAEYTQWNGNWYVKIEAFDNGGTVGAVFYAEMTEADDTFSPASTVINLFDYWSTDNRSDDDNHNITEVELESGINAGHALKFGRSIPKGYGDINYSWGGEDTPSKVTQGIVNKVVGSDGYPEFSGMSGQDRSKTTQIDQYLGTEKQESFSYLFDPSAEAKGKASFSNVTNLLTRNADGYSYYNCTERAAELDESTYRMKVYTSPGVYNGSAAVDNAGFGVGQFFPFNDARQTAFLQADKKPMNHYFGMSMTTRFIQEHNGYTSAKKTTPMTFQFSGDNDVWIFIDGVLVADLGGLRSAASVDIDFVTGDVTINDMYGALNGAETGTRSTTIRQAFEDALEGGDPRLDASKWRSITGEDGTQSFTFADNTTHTLKFYYLERGNFDSNLKLQFNLTEIPPTSIYKVDQYGDALEGAVFAAYQADKVTETAEDGTKTVTYRYRLDQGGTSPWNDGWYLDDQTGNIYADETAYTQGASPIITAGYRGVTDRSGVMKFADGDEMPFTESELKLMLTGTEEDGGCFILREISVPEGYRTVSDETFLRFSGGVIVCDNTFESGVWASNNAMVTASNTLYVAREYGSVAEKIEKNTQETMFPTFEVETDGQTVTYHSVNYYNAETNTRNGTMFVVPLKRNGRDFWHGKGYNYWFPIYGTNKDGYTIVDDYTYTDQDGVVHKGVPDEPATEEEWAAVTFDNAPTNAAAAIYAAQQQVRLQGGDDTGVVFEETGAGMQVLKENLPGNVERYYSWMNSNGRLVGADGAPLTAEEKAALDAAGDPQYVVAYYWTSADSLEGATVDNTLRIYSHSNLVPGIQSELQIQWGTTIEVPNMENRLFFQKKNEAGELVNDAVFALYDVFDAAPRKEGVSYGYNYIYYIGADAGGNKVYVAPLDNSENPQPGRAAVFGINGDGSVYVIGYGDYEVQWEASIQRDGEGNYAGIAESDVGRMTVTIDAPAKNDAGENVVPVGSLYYVDPAVDADGNALVGATHNSCAAVTEEGTGHFDKLKEGRYYLREIAAPPGYALNGEEIPVLVNQYGVYANAGSGDNDVSVGNGIGYLSSTMSFFATHGEIDETLTWVYGALIQNNAEDFSAFDQVSGNVLHVGEGGDKDQWHFVKKASAGSAEGGDGLSDSRSEAVVTYLEYSDALGKDSEREVIFDYTPNVDQGARGQAGAKGAATLSGENAIRLFTSVGWSDLAIYQDYDYGSNQGTTGHTTYYEDLTSYGNISNLFSSSTFVQVTDKTAIDMAVKKVSAADFNQTLSGATFRLSYKTDDGTPYYYRVSDNGKVSWTKENASVTTGEDGLAMFSDLTDGVYYLEELEAPAGYRPLNGPVTIEINGGKLQIQDTSLAEGVVSDGGKLQSDNKMLYTLTVPNSDGYELPRAGGRGTEIYTLSGLLLAAASLGYLVWRGGKERCVQKYDKTSSGDQ